MRKIPLCLFIPFCLHACLSNGNQTQSNDAVSKDEWNYTITNFSVGTISIDSTISSVKTRIPSEYVLIDEKVHFDGDEENHVEGMGLYQDHNLVLRIFPVADSDQIYSIMVFDPQYTTLSTGIHVGSNIKDLKRHYTIDDAYFNIADGLYLKSKQFHGSFMIDMEGQGDAYESIQSLPDAWKIKAIIINRQ